MARLPQAKLHHGGAPRVLEHVVEHLVERGLEQGGVAPHVRLCVELEAQLHTDAGHPLGHAPRRFLGDGDE